MRAILLEALDNDSGQSSIDFLFGFAIFIVTFIFAISFVAGLFVPFQPGAIDLNSVAYSTSAILVEDPGWHIYSGPDGHQVGDAEWESAAVDQLARVGLADDKSHPNVLSMDKIDAFRQLTDPVIGNYSVARDKIGLNGSVIYDFTVYLTMNDTLNNTKMTLLNTSCPDATTGKVETINRYVMVDTGKELSVDNALTDMGHDERDSALFVDISNWTTRGNDLKIMIYNATGDITDVDVQNGTNIVPADNYSVRLNGTIRPLPITINVNDIVEITVNNSSIYDPNVNSVIVKANSSIFIGRPVDYMSDPLYKQKSVLYPGVLTLDVWSDAFA